jgi:hypothetical protein
MNIFRQNNYNIIILNDGKLIKEACEVINSGIADGINFLFTKNFPADINDIRLAPGLKHIQINDYSRDNKLDYDAIKYLTRLESITINTTDKKEINYLNFPLLRTATLTWRPKAKSIFQCVNLEVLSIGSYKEPDLSNLESLRNLLFLRVNLGSIKSVKGIESLQNLKTLWLTQTTKLEDLSGIEKLSNLQFLRIDNCRNIKNIRLVTPLKKTIRLEICGTTPKL